MTADNDEIQSLIVGSSSSSQLVKPTAPSTSNSCTGCSSRRRACSCTRLKNNKLVPILYLLLIIVVVVAIATIAVFDRFQIAEGAERTFARGIHVTRDPTRTELLLQIGKSCRYTNNAWRCQDCRNSTCTPLKPRGRCPPFRWYQWDDPAPRYQSANDPTEIEEVRTLTLRFHSYEGQPPCRTLASCFNLSRCRDDVLTIYSNQTGPHALIDHAVAVHSNSNSNNNNNSTVQLQRVDRYQDACLVVVDPHTYKSEAELKAARHWHDDGRNHLLWHSSQFTYEPRRLNVDSPFPSFHVGHAALASVSLDQARLRPGYDMVLPLRRRWGRRVPPQDVDVHRPRSCLVGFRGSIQRTLHPNYQHRWLAAEYWETSNDPLDDDDVKVDAQCLGRHKEVIHPYHNLSASAYGDFLWNCTFQFCPGGSGVGSFRFGEVLSTGGIPIVTPDFGPPLAPELDWSDCVVQVSEARIIDIPRILRHDYLQPDALRQRQQKCWELHRIVYGEKAVGNNSWQDDERVVFGKAMEIWAIRIANALDMERRKGFVNP